MSTTFVVILLVLAPWGFLFERIRNLAQINLQGRRCSGSRLRLEAEAIEGLLVRLLIAARDCEWSSLSCSLFRMPWPMAQSNDLFPDYPIFWITTSLCTVSAYLLVTGVALVLLQLPSPFPITFPLPAQTT